MGSLTLNHTTSHASVVLRLCIASFLASCVLRLASFFLSFFLPWRVGGRGRARDGRVHRQVREPDGGRAGTVAIAIVAWSQPVGQRERDLDRGRNRSIDPGGHAARRVAW